MASRVFSAILPKSRRATGTHCLNLADSSSFFSFFSLNVLEVLFFNSFLEVTLGSFFVKILPKKKKEKTLLYNVTVSTHTAKS